LRINRGGEAATIDTQNPLPCDRPPKLSSIEEPSLSSTE
jgi:hypothetical protein